MRISVPFFRRPILGAGTEPKEGHDDEWLAGHNWRRDLQRA
jgi:hypothetical protein